MIHGICVRYQVHGFNQGTPAGNGNRWCNQSISVPSSMKVLEIPRLTGSLRAFSGLSLPSHVSDTNKRDELVRKRKIRAKKQREGELTWTELKTAIQDCIVDDLSLIHI